MKKFSSFLMNWAKENIEPIIYQPFFDIIQITSRFAEKIISVH